MVSDVMTGGRKPAGRPSVWLEAKAPLGNRFAKYSCPAYSRACCCCQGCQAAAAWLRAEEVAHAGPTQASDTYGEHCRAESLNAPSMHRHSYIALRMAQPCMRLEPHYLARWQCPTAGPQHRPLQHRHFGPCRSRNKNVHKKINNAVDTPASRPGSQGELGCMGAGGGNSSCTSPGWGGGAPDRCVPRPRSDPWRVGARSRCKVDSPVRRVMRPGILQLCLTL